MTHHNKLTWQQANREAESRLAMVLDQVAQVTTMTGERPTHIPLTDYPTVEDYTRLLGDNPGWCWEEHRMINQAMARLLSRQKLKVRKVSVRADDFLAWCMMNGKKNTTATRAEYAASIREKG